MAFFARGNRYSTAVRTNNPSPLRTSTAAPSDRSGDLKDDSSMDDKSTQQPHDRFVILQPPTNKPGTFKKRESQPEEESLQQESRLEKQERLIQGQFVFVQGPSKKPGTFGKSESKPTEIPGLSTTDVITTPQLRDQVVITQAPSNKPGTFGRRDPEPENNAQLSATNESITPRRSRTHSVDDWPRDPMTGVRYELTVILYEAAPRSNNWTIDTPTMRKDLGDERPRWILSAYGGSKDTPASLFEGNEYSPEEVRWRFYELASKGQEAQADQEALQLWSKADRDFKDALGRVNDIQKYMEDAEKKHPNRYDYTKMDGTTTKDEFSKSIETTHQVVQSQSSGFGAGGGFGQSPASSNPFSKPAAASFGQASGPSAFGSSPFGKPATNSAFGQPAFGQSAAGPSTSSSAFGQPAAPSAFGQPAAPSAFGKPAFGQGLSNSSPFASKTQTSAFGSPAFGQPAQSAQSAQSASTFSQTNQSTPAFGQSLQPSAFGQPSQPGFGQSPFGQAARTGSGFGQSGFGQPAFGQSQEPGKSSPFGQTASPFGAGTASAGGFGQPPSSSPFGAGNTNAGGFGQSAQQNSSPFGAQPATSAAPEVSMDSEQPSGFNQQPVNNNPFGASNAPSQTTEAPPLPFGANPAPTSTNTSSNLPQNLNNGQSTPLHYSQTVPNQTKQQTQRIGEENTPVYRRPDGKGLEKLWFPDADATQEVVALNREDKIGDIQAPKSEYTDNVLEAYRNLAVTGKFEAGKMPAVPPLREWTSYDF